MARLGEDHLSIRTQYRLLPITGAGFLLNDLQRHLLQRHLLQGHHDWQAEPEEADGCIYVAGMDVGGEARPTLGSVSVSARGHDSTVITIGKVTYNDLMLPRIDIVHHYCWTGTHYLEQYSQTVAICQLWGVRTLVVDRTGLGDIMASLLAAKLGNERVTPFHFSRPSKSTLTYALLGLINSGRLTLYRPDEAPSAIYDECWKQLRTARYRVPGENLLDMYVDPTEGHDDFLMSIALTCHALTA